MAAAGKAAWFLQWQKESQDMWDFYREVGGISNYDKTRRQASIAARQVPVGRGPAVPTPAAAQLVSTTMVIQPPNVTMFVDPNDKVFIRRILNPASMRAHLQNAGLQYVRTIGAGSNGMATLWHLTRADGNNINLVLKTRFDAYGPKKEMRREKARLDMLARAPHIVKRINLRRAMGPQLGDADAAALALDGPDLAFLWLQYIRNGSLDDLIRNVEALRPRENFPASILWSMFDCLADGIIAMAYPPIYQRRTRRNRRTQSPIGDDLAETIPEVNGPPDDRQLKYKNIVHLDLDPQNVLVGETGNTGHANPVAVETYLITDFGKARQLPEDFGYGVGNYTDHVDIWTSREEGKDGYFTPEQFCSQWDQVDLVPYNEGFDRAQTRNSPSGWVAGNYSEKTNIYQAAQIIRCCMIFEEPEEPPLPTPVGSFAGRLPRFTYGSDVPGPINVASFGRPLCDLVQDCMMHLPAERPSLRDLKRRTAAGKQANPVTAADRTWMNNRLYGAPVAPNAVPLDQPTVPAAAASIPDGQLFP